MDIVAIFSIIWH